MKASSPFQRLNKILLGLILLSPLTSAAEESPESEESATAPSLVTEALPRIGFLEREMSKVKALADSLEGEELVWLDINYPNYNEPIKGLNVAKQPTTPESQGAVLIIHDMEQHLDWPVLIRPLREKLTDSGWYTLSVNLPEDAVNRAPPTRTRPAKRRETIPLTPAIRTALITRQSTPLPPSEGESGEASDAPTSETENPLESDQAAPDPEKQIDINLAASKVRQALPPYEDMALLHIKRALEHIHDEGFRNVIVVAIGNSADLALRHMNSKLEDIGAKGFALIMIDAKLKDDYQNDIGKALGEDFAAPILDIVDGSKPKNDILAEQRKRFAMKVRTKQFHQISLATIYDGSHHKTLLKRIDRWLLTYAPGIAATGFKVQ